MRSSPFRFLSLLLLLCIPALAQSYAPPAEPSAPVVPMPDLVLAYGTALTVTTWGESEFDPIDSSVTYAWADGRFTTVSGALGAHVGLPTGNQIVLFQLEGCDLSDTGFAELTLLQCDVPPAVGCAPLGTINTGMTEMPGCGVFTLSLIPTDAATPPLPLPVPVIANATSRYILQFNNSVTDGNVRLRAARIGHLRQVSPAPETATFLDVPVGHPLHAFVEAVAAAGITAGCGGGNFCPNSAVTRGQMAVFLAKALGLHWPL